MPKVVVPSERSATDTSGKTETSTNRVVPKTVQPLVQKNSVAQTNTPSKAVVTKPVLQENIVPNSTQPKQLDLVSVAANEKTEVLQPLSSSATTHINWRIENKAMNLPTLAETASDGKSVLADLNQRMINSTCKTLPNDATFSERLLGLADCKTSTLLKKVSTNVTNEYKYLRGY